MANLSIDFDYQQAIQGLQQVQQALQGVTNAATTAGQGIANGLGNGTGQTQQQIGLIEQLRKTIETLTKARDEAFDEKKIQDYNRQLAAARVSLNGLENATGQTAGRMQNLREEIQRITKARDEAFDDADIIQYNRQIQALQANLQRVSTQGLDPINERATLGDRLFSRLGATVAALAATASFGAIAQGAINAAKEYETAAVSLEVLAGSATAALQLQSQLQAFVAKTPFELPQAQGATKNLLAYGFQVKEIIPNLERLGNIAAAVNVPLDELAQIYGKAKLGNFIQAEELNQLADRGIPVFESLAAQLGRNVSEIKKLGSEGKISFKNLQVAFDELGGAGGRFYGLIDKQSQTLAGRLSTLRDDAREASRAFGEGFNVSLKELTIQASQFFKSLDKDALKEMGLALGQLVKGMVSFGKEIIYIGIAITAYKGLAAALRLVELAQKGALLSNPVNSAWVIGITAATYAIDKYTDSIEKAREAERKLNDLRKEVIETAQAEVSSANALFEVAKSKLATDEERKKAARALLDQYPEALKNYKDEKELLGDLATAQDIVTSSLVKQALARVEAQKIQEQGLKYLEAEIKKQEAETKFQQASTEFANQPKRNNVVRNEAGDLNNSTTNNFASQNYLAAKAELDGANNAIKEIDANSQQLKKAFDGMGESLIKAFGSQQEQRLGVMTKNIEILKKKISETSDAAIKLSLTEQLKTQEALFAKEVKAIQNENANGKIGTSKTKAQQEADEKAAKYEKDLRDKLAKLRKEAQEADEESRIARLEGIEKELAQVDLKYAKELDALNNHLIKKKNLTDLEQQVNTAVYEASRSLTEKAQAELLAIRVKYMKESIKKQAELTIQFEKERAESDKRAAETQIKLENEKLDLEESTQALKILMYKTGFNAKKRSDKEIAEYQKTLEQAQILSDLDVAKKRLQIQLDFNKNLSDLEKERIETQIRTLEIQEFNVKSGKSKDGEQQESKGDKGKTADFDFSLDNIFTKITGNKEQSEGLAELTNMAIDQVNSLADAYVEAANRMVEAADRRVDSAQNALNTEIELAKLGYANNVGLRQKELENAKNFQTKAIEEQRKAAQIQNAINAVQTGVELAAAAAKIMAKVAGSTAGIGIPIAIGLIAAMFSAFAASKAKARESASYEVGGDAYIDHMGIIRGKRHRDGGVGIEVEGGEAVIAGKNRISIVNRKMTTKHLDLISAINADDRMGMFRHLQALTGGISPNYDIVQQMQSKQGTASINQTFQYQIKNDNAKVERLLEKRIAQESEKESITYANGCKIVKKGNVTRIIRI